MVERATPQDLYERAEAILPLLAGVCDEGGGRPIPLPDEDDPESLAGQLLRVLYGDRHRERRCPTTLPPITPSAPAS